MDEYESLSHTRWDCKYHVVFIPKCRRKALYWLRVFGFSGLEELIGNVDSGERGVTTAILK